MPAIDILEEGNDLVVTIDLPGFAKKRILISELSSMSVRNCQKRADRDTWHGLLHAQAAQDRQKGSVANIL